VGTSYYAIGLVTKEALCVRYESTFIHKDLITVEDILAPDEDGEQGLILGDLAYLRLNREYSALWIDASTLRTVIDRFAKANGGLVEILNGDGLGFTDDPPDSPGALDFVHIATSTRLTRIRSTTDAMLQSGYFPELGDPTFLKRLVEPYYDEYLLEKAKILEEERIEKQLEEQREERKVLKAASASYVARYRKENSIVGRVLRYVQTLRSRR
jgi:hypothetical protein